MFHSRYTDWVCKGKFSLQPWQPVRSEILSIMKDKFCCHAEKPYSHYRALEMSQLRQTRTGTALSALKTWQTHTKLEVWDVYLMGLDVKQVRNYWTGFSVNTIRTQCERAFGGRSKRTNLYIKSFHCNFFTVHTINCLFLFRMKQEILAQCFIYLHIPSLL